MAYDLWGLKLNLNFSSSSLRIMSSSARYERYKGNQVLFWWVHSTCWSSSAEMWANPMFCMLLYVICFSVIVHNRLKALAEVVVAVVQCWFFERCPWLSSPAPRDSGGGYMCVSVTPGDWKAGTVPSAAGGALVTLSRWHCIPGAGTACTAPCQSSLHWRGMELKQHHFTLQELLF